MKRTILFTLVVTGLILSGCNSSSQPELKDANEIEKLTQQQFSEETAAIYANVFQEVGDLLIKHGKVDANFEKTIDKIFDRSAKQMIEYGKVLAKKDAETRQAFIMTSSLDAWTALEKLDAKFMEDAEKQLEVRQQEFEDYGSENLDRKFDELFSIMNFLDFEQLKEEHPETAKEFGIQ